MGRIRDWAAQIESGPDWMWDLSGEGTDSGQETGPGGPPQTLTERQRYELEKFFHQRYGRYPISEDEFKRWLKHNW